MTLHIVTKKKMVVQFASFKHICFKMFLIESFKSSSFRMTLPFVVHNSSVFCLFGFFLMPLRPKPCLRQWYSSNLPFEWLESQSWESTKSDFFPKQRDNYFPNFPLQHWKEHRGKMEGTPGTVEKCTSWNSQGVLGVMIHSVFVTSPILGSNKATSKWGNRPGGQHVCEHGFKTSLCAYIAYI